jgi:hypothetical protein
LLAVLLAGCGQYLAAFSLARSFARIGGSESAADGNRFESFSAPTTTAPTVQTAEPIDVSRGPLIVLAFAAVAGGLAVAVLDFFAITQTSAGSALAYAGLGLIPGVGGMIAGAQATRAEWKVFPGEATNGLLMRLGRSGFYFDAFLFLFVLVPLRGVAGLARFVDWAVIDTVASGGPSSLLESSASFFGPLQKRGVTFYLFSAMLGTVVLSVLMIWLRG